MKKSIIIIGLVLLASCKKNWDCTISQKWNEAEWVEAGTVHFEGSREDMEAYETNTTTTSTIGDNELHIKTECN